MRISFIQLATFRSSWRRLGMNDDDLQELESEILKDPSIPPMIRGTGGLRKIRFAGHRTAGGKSGGIRV